MITVGEAKQITKKKILQLNIRYEVLPKYLRNDLILVEQYDRKGPIYDCYLDEVYSSINSAMCDGIISLSDADNLRKVFYFDNMDKGL